MRARKTEKVRKRRKRAKKAGVKVTKKAEISHGFLALCHFLKKIKILLQKSLINFCQCVIKYIENKGL